MKTVQQLMQEREDLVFEAKGIWEAVQKANPPRDLTQEESKRLDELTDKKEGLIAKLDKQIAEAKEREDAILAVSIRERRQSRIEELNESLGVGQATNAGQGQRNLILPVNGQDAVQHGRRSQIYQKVSKLKAFKSDEDAFNAGMWLRCVMAREYNRDDRPAALHVHRLGWEVTAAANEGSGAAGGYLVPAPIAATIIDVRERVGVARRVCDIQPMTSDTQTFPKRGSGYTVYYPGEANTITTSDMTKSQVETIARKRACAGEISQELIDDAIVSVADNAFSEMGYALALKEDEEFIDGNGTSSYGNVRGIKNRLQAGGVSTAATGHDTWAELDMADVTAWLGLLPDRFDRMPSIICSRAFYWNVLLRLELQAGGNNVQSLQQGDGGTRTFAGYPVYFTHFMPTSTAAATVCAFFGDFSMGVILADRMGLRIARDDSIGFLRDVSTLKATSRYDFNVYEPGTATLAGAYVGLKTAA